MKGKPLFFWLSLFFSLIFLLVFNLSFTRYFIEICLAGINGIIFFLDRAAFYLLGVYFVIGALKLFLELLGSIRLQKTLLSDQISTDKFKERFSDVKSQDYRKIIVVDRDEVFAFVLGFFSPRVFISRGLLENLSKEEISSVLEHEFSHVASFDNLKKLGFAVFVYLLPFYFFSKPIFDFFRLRQELAADKKVGKPKFLYLSFRKFLASGSILGSSSIDFLDNRIAYLQGKQKLSFPWFSFLGLILIIAVFFSGFLIQILGSLKKGCYFASACHPDCSAQISADTLDIKGFKYYNL